MPERPFFPFHFHLLASTRPFYLDTLPRDAASSCVLTPHNTFVYQQLDLTPPSLWTLGEQLGLG